MRKTFIGTLIATALFAAAPVMAGPISYNFSYTSGSNTYDFGTMTISVVDSDSLSVRFDTGNPSGAGDFEVTGFGFDFNPEKSNLTVSNPDDSTFNWDHNSRDWIKLTNLNPIPNPANSSVTKSAFEFGVTEGQNNNINPPGLEAGEKDIFYLDGFSGLSAATNVGALIDWAGIRIQSLPDRINDGSLFLVNTTTPPTTKVSEPMSLALLSAGLLALGVSRRRRR